MFGTLETGSEIERPAAFFRYTVRADRQRAKEIEVAARKAGCSIENFVQAWFDRILDDEFSPAGQGLAQRHSSPGSPAAPARDEVKATFDAGDFAERHEVTLVAARVWALLMARADTDETGTGVRIAQARAGDLSLALDCHVETVRNALKVLHARNLAVNLGPAGPWGCRYVVKGR